MSEARVQYAQTADGISIAYSVAGEGYPTIYCAGPPFTHVQQENLYANYSEYNNAIGRGRMLVRFDHRGNGLSDRDVGIPTLDKLVSDIEAIVSKLGLDKFVLAGTQASGVADIAYAVKHPEKVSHLVLMDSYPSGARFIEIPQVRAFLGLMQNDWNLFTESLAHFFFGWDAGEPARHYAAFLRECVDRDEAQRFFEAILAIDVTDLLPQVKQPTLILQHRSITIPGLDIARFLTSRLPNAELVVLEGSWGAPADDPNVIDREVSKLLGMEPSSPPPAAARPVERRASGSLVTILFTDVEGSTALTQRLGDLKAREVFREHERITREALSRFGGSEVKTMGDGFMASFGSANSAIECSIEMQRAFARAREGSDTPVHVRIGLNAGEPIAEDEDLFGTPVIIASRIAAQANGGEILASNVVRELIAGRGFMFNDRGDKALRGFEDPIRVFEVHWAEED